MSTSTQSAARDGLLQLIRDGKPLSLRQQVRLTFQLSVPAIMAELSSIAMQYIDASMVGRLGADESASIGLVSTSLWLFGGLCNAAATGFAVQVAHLLGAGKAVEARRVVRQALTACGLLAVGMAVLGVAISQPLPVWLGGSTVIRPHASIYFMIFMLCTPLLMVDFVASAMLRCSGNMRVPSLLNMLMCLLDVVFNFFLIFPTRRVTLLGTEWTMPGAGLGVTGAALGTALAEGVIAVLMLRYLVTCSQELCLTQERGSFRPTRGCLRRAVHIAAPMGIQHIMMCSAAIIITAIVAPLGSVALAANAFAVTAESLCYMPGYGIADAATTLVGQSVGAGRRRLTRSLAWIAVLSGMVVMGVMGVLMYVLAPQMMGIMSPVPEVVALGSQCLRIEAWAEPLFAAAIVSYGVFVGAGDTLAPCGINLASMWGVRLTLSALLVGSMGLRGVWTAMCIELCVRGSIYLLRLASNGWLKHAFKSAVSQ